MNLQKEVSDEENLKERAKKVSIAEGSAYSIMDGFGLRYITPFGVALGASSFIIGLISSMPNLLGNIFQLLLMKSFPKYRRKSIVLLGVLLQAIMWLPLVGVGVAYFVFGISSLRASLTLLVIYSLIVISGALVGPAWSSWMRSLVSEKSGDYFGKRNTIIGVLALVCMFAAGLILDHFKKDNSLLIAFAIIFSIAFIGRAISSYLITRQYEPKFIYEENKYFSFVQFLKKAPSNNFGRFAIFLGLIGFATAVSSPYFAVYMLRDLGFEKIYIAYTLVTMSSILSALLVTRLWGRTIDKYGNVRVMKINAFLIFVIPILWIASYWIAGRGLSTLIFYLCLIEIISGIVWAGFNLAAGVFLYEAVTKERMHLCVTYNGVISSTGALLGALLGGVMIKHSIMGLHPVLTVFALSAFLRLVAGILLYKNVKEVRPVQDIQFSKIKLAIRYLNPMYLLQGGIKRTGFPSE